MKTLALRARVFIHCFLVFGYPGETLALVVHILRTGRKQGFKAHLAHFNFVKVCEDFVVEKLIKPAVLEIVDPHQFGTVPESSTNHALISVVHYLTSVKDGNGCLARLALFDFRKGEGGGRYFCA